MLRPRLPPSPNFTGTADPALTVLIVGKLSTGDENPVGVYATSSDAPRTELRRANRYERITATPGDRSARRDARIRTAWVGPVQSATGTPFRNTCTSAGATPPSALASIVNVATYGVAGPGAGGATISTC